MDEADGEASGGRVREREGWLGRVCRFGEGRGEKGGGGILKGDGGRITLSLMGDEEQNLDLYQSLWSRHTKEGSE